MVYVPGYLQEKLEPMDIHVQKIRASETKPKVSFIDLKVVASCIYGVTHFVLQVLGVGTLTKLPKTFRLALVSLK